jgi:peptidase C39-like protein
MRFSFAIAIAVALVLSNTTTTATAKTVGAPPVQFMRASLNGGTASGVQQSGGALTLASSGLSAGSYDDPFDKDPDRGAIPYQSGSWTSTWTGVPFEFDELVASWNAETPAGTWIRIEMQASGPGREHPTKWYLMGIWASSDADIHRTSRGGQGDGDGFVAIDTFIRDKQALPLDSYQLRITLYRASGNATPRVRMVGAMVSAGTAYDIPSAFGGRARDLAVPSYSQEIHRGEFSEYDNGGEAWCSPTSTAMVLAFWRKGPSNSDLEGFPGPGYTDPQVDYAARYVYDWHYQGAGNWPDNTAYAARFGLNAFVTRLRSLTEAELFINAGIPLVASIQGNLPGFFFKKTSGHLLVIRGFTRTGDVIANDPAVPTDADVTKVYDRADFENVWLGGSAGIVYVIYPPGHKLPANVPNLPANW